MCMYSDVRCGDYEVLVQQPASPVGEGGFYSRRGTSCEHITANLLLIAAASSSFCTYQFLWRRGEQSDHRQPHPISHASPTSEHITQIQTQIRQNNISSSKTLKLNLLSRRRQLKSQDLFRQKSSRSQTRFQDRVEYF